MYEPKLNWDRARIPPPPPPPLLLLLLLLTIIGPFPPEFIPDCPTRLRL
jgi:hypothetical protein